MLHGFTYREHIFREDYVIKNYLGGTLDDLVAQLDPATDEDAMSFVEVVKLAVDNKLKDIDVRTNELFDKFKGEYAWNWAAFATQEHKSAHFGLVRTLWEKPEDYNRRKVEYILAQTCRLKLARFFVTKWGGAEGSYITKWNKTKEKL
jgi:hypothetical protein